ncbi:hypothetical protein SteCoe_33271 [Stentor coeruleus]|uniref:Rap-GAP domain-containing protein n=1 Tax=Stentor coeruleus TaxID=5963 RepID=A0A1R2AX90_9CILI|nr:hypothetical protein SteCoe_33271 [Stentor coeruleus]
MNNILKWFSNKPSDNLAGILEILNEEKSLSKRHSIIINYIQKLLKNSNEKFNPRLQSFFKEHGEMVNSICLTCIFQTDHKYKIKSWEEVTDTFIALIEMTQYGQINRVEDLQIIAKFCLQDGNRYELKHFGLKLIMNIVSYKDILVMPFDIFQAAIDLGLFGNEGTGVIRREILRGNDDPKWMIQIKEVLNKVPGKVLDFKKNIDFVPENDMVKEGIFMFRDVLVYTLIGSFDQDQVNYIDHFRKWLLILRKSYLFVLYPDLINPDHLGGFKNCPHILHFLIIAWICKFAKHPEISMHMFEFHQDRELILGIIEKSFILFNKNSTLSQQNALKSYEIFESWIQTTKPLYLKDITKEQFSLNIIKHIICIFNYKNDTSKNRIEICAKSFDLLRIFYDKFPENVDFIKTLLLLCEILYKQDKCKNLIEVLSSFILKVMKKGVINNQKGFKNIIEDFERYLHIWANEYIEIIENWKNKTFEISEETDYGVYSNKNQLKYWLDFIRILGNPLEFGEKAQNEWVRSLKDIISDLLEKMVSPAVLLQCFLTDLSKLILEGFESTQLISLDTLCLLYTKSTYEGPSSLQTQHLFYLLSVAIKRPYLEKSVLAHSPKLLDYRGNHVLLKHLIDLANNYMNEGLIFIYRIISLPNYYKDTTLLTLDNVKTTYLSLKNDIFNFFIKILSIPPRAKALEAFTVFLIEEISYENSPFINKGIEILLNICNDTDQNTAVLSLQSIGTIAQILPSYQEYILDFVIKKVFDEKKFFTEALVIAILELILSLLMNLKANTNKKTLDLLFGKIAKLNELIDSDCKLKTYIDVFLSFLGFYFLNFPIQDNCVEIFDSNMSENFPSKEEGHYSLNNNTIITLYKDKFVIRNEFGKFLWTCSSYDIFDGENKTQAKDKLLSIFENSKLSLKIQENPSQLPASPALELLISFIHSNYKYSTRTYPLSIHEDLSDQIHNFVKLENTPNLNTKPRPPSSKSSSLSQIFIANLGLQTTLDPIPTSEKLSIALNLLDKSQARNQIRIGILYIKPGQDNEKEILSSNSSSFSFQEFLTKIGRVVELTNYKGNLGGLDPESCGKISIAYTDWEYDIMFHVPLLMPTDKNDNQQLLKKRHVGNDRVVIVWSENWKEYRQDTIITQFNLVNLIIYPLEKQLYRIQIQIKPRVVNLEFGPLKDGMVVHWKVLPFLIRLTAVNANRAINIRQMGIYEKQHMLRYKSIKEIIRDSGIEPKFVDKKTVRQSFTHFSQIQNKDILRHSTIIS